MTHEMTYGIITLHFLNGTFGRPARIRTETLALMRRFHYHYDTGLNFLARKDSAILALCSALLSFPLLVRPPILPADYLSNIHCLN